MNNISIPEIREQKSPPSISPWMQEHRTAMKVVQVVGLLLGAAAIATVSFPLLGAAANYGVAIGGGILLSASVGSWVAFHIEAHRLASHLQSWCKEVEGTDEYEKRIKAAKRIQECHAKGLTTLALYYLDLSSIPSAVWSFTRLKKLFLSGNKLQELPKEIGKLQNLDSLHLQDNQFQTLPKELADLKNLRWIEASHNQIRALPNEFANLPEFYHFDLSNNQLEFIPESLLQRLLRSEEECSVRVYENRFSQDYFSYLRSQQQQFSNCFLQIARGEKKEYQDNLESWLRLWAKEGGVSETAYLGLKQVLRGNEGWDLKEFLRKLQQTQEYHDRKPELVSRMNRILQLACTKESFRDKMVACVGEGFSTCGDRALILFNDLDILWQLYHTDLDEEAFRSLAIREMRYRLLKLYGDSIPSGDHVEAILHLFLLLKKELDLPVSIERAETVHPKMWGVTKEVCRQAVAEIQKYTDEELLKQSDHWQQYQARRYPEEAEKVAEHFVILHEQMLEYHDIEDTFAKESYLREHPHLEPIAHIRNVREFSTEITKMRGEALAMLPAVPFPLLKE